MNRLRIALIVFFIALALPVGVLVTRALRSAELEQRVRYDAVTERIFDEMERTLSDFLAGEEARPPDAYRFYLVEEGEEEDERSRPERSPLSHPAAEPFVIAHFQIAPDGSLLTPLRPADATAARRAGDWPDPPEVQVAIDRAIELLEREVAPFWRDAESKSKADASLQRLAKESDTNPGRSASGAPATTAPADDSASAYELLQSLNVGAKKRTERHEQYVEAESSPTASFVDAQANARPSEFRDGTESRDEAAGKRAVPRPSSRVASAAPRAPEAPPSVASDEIEEADFLAERLAVRDAAFGDLSSTAPAMAAPAQTSGRAWDRSERTGERVRVTLEPMAGRPIGERYLMLHRTVVIDGEGYRQGLLIDRDALGHWLTEQVIGTGPLAERASARFGPGEPEPTDPAAHLAWHAFAEPFTGLEAVLRVAPLRDSGSVTTIHWLAALLAVVAVLGLGSVHRMAAVIVDFAERRSNFVAAVSHELKTPLTAIRMHGEMLRDGLVADESRRQDYYRTITDESERLSRLIDNVLEFSRLEKNGRALSIAVGSPAPVVADIVERLRPHAERAGFTLTTEIADVLPPVGFDRDALTQMIFNLVDNAIKYAANAERREIIVRCRAEGGGIAISVRDFGPGVPADHLGRIFEPFHRVEDELTRSTKGSGIGLSLVKQLGEAMGAVVRGNNLHDGGFEVRIGLSPASVA